MKHFEVSHCIGSVPSLTFDGTDFPSFLIEKISPYIYSEDVKERAVSGKTFFDIASRYPKVLNESSDIVKSLLQIKEDAFVVLCTLQAISEYLRIESRRLEYLQYLQSLPVSDFKSVQTICGEQSVKKQYHSGDLSLILSIRPQSEQDTAIVSSAFRSFSPLIFAMVQRKESEIRKCVLQIINLLTHSIAVHPTVFVNAIVTLTMDCESEIRMDAFQSLKELFQKHAALLFVAIGPSVAKCFLHLRNMSSLDVFSKDAMKVPEQSASAVYNLMLEMSSTESRRRDFISALTKVFYLKESSAFTEEMVHSVAFSVGILSSINFKHEEPFYICYYTDRVISEFSDSSIMFEDEGEVDQDKENLITALCLVIQLNEYLKTVFEISDKLTEWSPFKHSKQLSSRKSDKELSLESFKKQTQQQRQKNRDIVRFHLQLLDDDFSDEGHKRSLKRRRSEPITRSKRVRKML